MLNLSRRAELSDANDVLLLIKKSKQYVYTGYIHRMFLLWRVIKTPCCFFIPSKPIASRAFIEATGQRHEKGQIIVRGQEVMPQSIIVLFWRDEACLLLCCSWVLIVHAVVGRVSWDGGAGQAVDLHRSQHVSSERVCTFGGGFRWFRKVLARCPAGHLGFFCALYEW